MPDALNYARFDRMGDDSDDEDDSSSYKRVHDERKMQLLAQHDAMFLLVGWIAKACPKVSDVETTRIVRFVATADKAIEPDKAKRFAAVAKFIKDEATTNKIDRRALLELCNFAQARVSDAGDANERLAASRVLILAMGALNTLGAVEATTGGADALVSELEASPDGELARKIEDFEYAKAIVREAPPAADAASGARIEELPEPKGKGEGESEQEMSQEEEARLMREAMANARKKIKAATLNPAKKPWEQLTLTEKLGRIRRGNDERPWARILRSTGFNVGLIFVAWLCRQAYERYFEISAAAPVDPAFAWAN